MVTKQEQLEWLAKEFAVWPGFGGVPIRMSSVTIGEVNNGLGVAHHIRMEEWQQERDKMSSKPEVDDSWFTYCKLPPCGIPIELWFGGSFAYNCEFIAMRGNTYVVWNLDADKPDCADSLNSEFRPLRTEREKAIDAACKTIGDVIGGRLVVERLYDAGLLK